MKSIHSSIRGMIAVLFFVIISQGVFAQSKGLGIGLKAGLNFANITNASSINSSSAVGYHLGIFLAPPAHGILGSRTELIFSRQGYDFSTESTTGSVRLNYLMLPQFLCINITRFVQLQAGFQIAYLLSAKADTASNPVEEALSYYNRFDYGFAGGLEIHPFKGLLIGARYNFMLGDLYKSYDPNSGTPPPFIPTVNVKNNVLQFSAGYIF